MWHASPTAVVLTLENGENRQSHVPPGLKFDVDGQMKEAMDLASGHEYYRNKIRGVAAHRNYGVNVVTGETPKK